MTKYKGRFDFPRLTSAGIFVQRDESECVLSQDAKELFNDVFEELYVEPKRQITSEYPIFMNGGDIDAEDAMDIARKVDDNKKEVFNELRTQHNIEIIGEGINRVVFSTKDKFGRNQCVVKVPLFKLVSSGQPNSPIFESVMEIKNWQKAPDKIKDKLVPLTDNDIKFRWSVFPYVEQNDDLDVMNRFDDSLREQYKVEVVDMKIDNVGTYNSETRLLDYGSVISGKPVVDFDTVKALTESVKEEY